LQEVDKDKRVLGLYEVSIRFPGIFNNFIASKRDKAFFDSSFYNSQDERIKFLAETSLSTISKCKSLKERNLGRRSYKKIESSLRPWSERFTSEHVFSERIGCAKLAGLELISQADHMGIQADIWIFSAGIGNVKISIIKRESS
jgi:hypothetical protein